MSSLFAALGTAASSLDVMERAMGVVQNNVTNASTPGYVTQSLILNASPFDPTKNTWGGVMAGGVESSRDVFAEQAVWQANQQVGAASQQATSLSLLEQQFDVSGKSGIPAALSTLYSAFSAWSTSPTDGTSRQQVINAAQGVAQAFNQASSAVAQLQSQTIQQISTTAAQVNNLTSQIASMNADIRSGSKNDAGLDAQLYNSLEQLSGLVPINVRNESDGTVTVLMDGQVPLVIGKTSNALQVSSIPAGATNPGAPAHAQIVVNGQDVTSLIGQGQLGGLLQFRNAILPSLTGDGTQQGSLNQLAQEVADQVNNLLTSGQISSGPPPVPGVPLFTYTAGAPTSVAASLSVSSTITASQLAAISSTSANGTADQLAQLATWKDPALNDLSFTDAYAGTASAIGNQAANAASMQQTQTQMLTQVQNMRAQVSGVSLNEQAAKLLQFQQAYQASAQLISVINTTTQYLLQMMQQIQ